MDKKLLKMATETMRELELSEIKLRDGECEVYLRRSDELVREKSALGDLKGAASAYAKESSVLPSLDIEGEVRAPLLGVFHRGEIGGDSFVSVGDSVSKGDVLGIIEAMKLQTPIYAEFDGTVEEIYAASGTLVEFGQLLFLIKKNQ